MHMVSVAVSSWTCKLNGFWDIRKTKVTLATESNFSNKDRISSVGQDRTGDTKIWATVSSLRHQTTSLCFMNPSQTGRVSVTGQIQTWSHLRRIRWGAANTELPGYWFQTKGFLTHKEQVMMTITLGDNINVNTQQVVLMKICISVVYLRVIGVMSVAFMFVWLQSNTVSSLPV